MNTQESSKLKGWRVGDAGFTVFAADAPHILLTGKDRDVVRLAGAAPTLLETLAGMTRIVEAFSYTTQLGKTQRERLNAAKAIIAQLGDK